MYNVKNDIKGVKSLSTIPVVMRRVIEVVSDENASFEDLSHVIEHDQAIAEKVVSMANSPFFGHTGMINSIEQAVMFLGFDLVKSIAISMTVIHLFNKTEAKKLTEFWEHSLEVAITSDLLCKKIPITNGGVCFLAGLLHDIGRLVLYLVYKSEYAALFCDSELLEKEKDLYGATHAEIGGWFLEETLLPEEVVLPVYYHHGMENLERHKGIVLAVLLAEALVARFSENNTSDGTYNEKIEEILISLGFTEEAIEGIGEILKKEQDNIKSFFRP